MGSFYSVKSHTNSCKAELCRVAAVLEIMSECLNASLVEMTANQVHTHTNTHVCLVYLNSAAWERQPLLSHLNHCFSSPSELSPCHLFSTISLSFITLSLHVQPPPPSFILPVITFPPPFTFYLSVAMLAPSYITSAILYLSPSPVLSSLLFGSFSRSPVSHDIHSQLPLSLPLPLCVHSFTHLTPFGRRLVCTGTLFG